MLFLLFIVIFSIFLTTPVVKEKIKEKLALTIPTDVPMLLVNEIIDTPLVVSYKTNKNSSM